MNRFMIGAVLTLMVASGAHAGKATAGMRVGAPSFRSMGSLTFGPEGVLFIADTKAAAIIAVSTDDTKPGKAAMALKIAGLEKKIAGLLGAEPKDIVIEDMAVNPVSGNIYLSVSRGRGPEATPALVRVKGESEVELVALEKVHFSEVALPAAPAEGTPGRSNPRLESITDLAFQDGRLLVAGLSNEEFAATLRSIPFPFKDSANPTSVEIYHGAHGRFETRAPIRTFVPFMIGKEAHVLAAYTCTPLVQFPLSAIKPGAKIQGKTIAELGNRNRPLDIIAYQKDGRVNLLMANSARGVMKIVTESIEKAEPITAPVPDKKGVGYETLADWIGIDQLDKLNNKTAVVLRRDEGGVLTLETRPLP
jgi:hypothetical protein